MAISMLPSLTLGGLSGGFLGLLSGRKVPVLVMRVWFTVVLLGCVVVCFIVAHALRLASQTLHLISRDTQELYVRYVKSTMFHYVMPCCCLHVHTKYMAGSLSTSDLPARMAVCMCHTSFFDSLYFLWLMPVHAFTTAKTFLKASLLKLPLFGYVLESAGYFPVYFQSDEGDSFSVNKEKQALVAANVEKHLKNGGALAFFPEGAMNRTPEVLRDFRLGSFNTILQHKLPLYYCVAHACCEVWSPSLKGIPGFPADIYVYIGKLEYDAENMDARALATALREEMQSRLNSILEQRKKDGYKPAYVAPPPPLKKAD